MKISAVIRNPSRDLFNTINENKSSVQSTAIIVLGIIFGVLLYVFNSESLTRDLFEYFVSFTTDFSHKNKPEIFSGLLLPDLIYLIIMIILGTSAFGTPVVICINLVNSMGLGMLITYIYDNFALKGIEYSLLVLLPGKFLLVLAMILLTQNSVVTSKSIRELVHTKSDRVVDFKKYTIRSVVILAIILLSALIDFLTVISFTSLFEFG